MRRAGTWRPCAASPGSSSTIATSQTRRADPPAPKGTPKSMARIGTMLDQARTPGALPAASLERNMPGPGCPWKQARQQALLALPPARPGLRTVDHPFNVRTRAAGGSRWPVAR